MTLILPAAFYVLVHHETLAASHAVLSAAIALGGVFFMMLGVKAALTRLP